MRRVPLSRLTPEMILAKPVYHIDSLMLKVGTRDLGRYVSGLTRLGITHLYVTDKLSEDIIIEDAISWETRLNCKGVLFATMNRLSGQGVLDTDELSVSADKMMDDILTNEGILISMNEIGTIDDSTFDHSINAAIYAMILAKRLGYPRARTKKLAMGALLHDIGKTLVNQKILYKPGKLTAAEFEHVKQHTVLGYEALKKNDGLTEISRVMALSHHERLDGSGYPHGLKADDIHEFVRIASIVDVYDALISERCYHKKRTVYEAVSVMKAEAIGRMDVGLLTTFVKCLAIYPNGTMVKLSDGMTGIVKSQNDQMPYRPVVRIIQDAEGRPLSVHEVNLAKIPELKIQEARYVDEEENY
ncbi:MAG: HD-GYP domain-containing protein [Lachnospiraceae bacterium]|nr:HD-GYP domain-containing protein [Lachnospiraceae bacterium]